MELHVVSAGYFKLDGGAMFGVVPKKIWQKLNPPDQNNLCTWAMRSLIVINGNRIALIDTGMGDKQSEKFFSHYEPHGDTVELSLKKISLSPDDITDVILTHLHFDHCGGAVEKDKNGTLRPAFKNAIYWSHEKHWNWAMEPNQREKASFLKENFVPIQESGQLKFVEEGKEILPGVNFELAQGHTESQILPIIDYKGRKIAYLADLMPSPAHVPLPYVMAYDVRPLVTMHEKAVFLEKAYKEKYLLFFEHDPVHECAELVQTEKGFRAGDPFKLQEL